MKKWYMCLILAVLMALWVCPTAALTAERVEYEGLRLTTVEREPINFLSYGASGLDWLTEIMQKLVESGEPAVVFGEQVDTALEVTFIEALLGSNVDLVGGATLANEEPSNFLWGFKYTGWTDNAEVEGIWRYFLEFQPAAYNVRGQWFLGLAYKWRSNNT